MDDQLNILKVNIYGNDYPIKGNTDVEYIRRVAKYVDGKMKEVFKDVPSDSSLKIAILAALNITDELFKERTLVNKNVKVNSDMATTRIKAMIEKLNSKITNYYHE